uniref:Transposase n=1 Tax=Ditylenchus dipsaci TaxID=166011 RepID=A0A915EB28_9BILA
MNQYILHRDTFDKYYNCSLYDVNSIPLAQRTHYFIGISQLLLSTFLEFRTQLDQQNKRLRVHTNKVEGFWSHVKHKIKRIRGTSE